MLFAHVHTVFISLLYIHGKDRECNEGTFFLKGIRDDQTCFFNFITMNKKV